MSTLLMETDRVREVAGQMERWALTLLEQEEALRGASIRLETAWQSDGAAGFLGDFRSLLGRYRTRAEELQALALRLRKEVEEWELAAQPGMASALGGIVGVATGAVSGSSLLSPMGQSDAPVTPAQLDELARQYNVSAEWLKEHLAGRSQKEVYNLFIACGLTPDSGSVLDLPNMEHPEEYSPNQQLLELAMRYPPGSPEFERGKEYLSKVQEGTLCFTLGQGGIAGIISFGTATPQNGLGPSHAMLGVAPGVLASAERDGVVYRKAIDFYLDSLGEKNFLLRLQEVPGITPEQRHWAAQYAAGQVGKGYNIPGLVAGVPSEITDTWYCSELTYRALKEAGVDIVPPEQPSLQMAVMGPVAGPVIEWLRVSPAELSNARVNAPDLLGQMGIGGAPLDTSFEMDYRKNWLSATVAPVLDKAVQAAEWAGNTAATVLDGTKKAAESFVKTFKDMF